MSCESVFLNDGYDDRCDWSVFDKNKGISGIVWSRTVQDLENGRLVTTCRKPKYLKTSIIHVVYEAGYYQLVINKLGRNSFGWWIIHNYGLADE